MLTKTDLTEKALAVGRQNHWRFRVIDHQDLPHKPILKSEWLYVPEEKYNIPLDVQKCIDAIEQAGIPMQGVMIAHEAPRLLAAPIIYKESSTDTARDVSGALELITELLGLFLTGVVYLFSLAMMLDPAAVVVLEDGTWVEVMRWYE
jgi:hypothetical protein